VAFSGEKATPGINPLQAPEVNVLYCFKVSVVGEISGGNCLGKVGWFPDLGI